MSDVVEHFAYNQLGSEDVRIDQFVKQDVSQIIKDNALQAETSNGFSDGRTMRKIASVSTTDYLIALKNGFALDSTDPKILQSELRRYLATDAGRPSQTVRHILNPNGHSNIIIR